MKKIAFIAMAAGFSFVSCNNDDDNVTVGGTAELNGTWKLTTFTMDQGIDFNNDGSLSEDLIAETGCYNNSTLVFTGANTAIFNIEEVNIDMELAAGSQTDYNYTTECAGSTPEAVTYTSTPTTVTIDFPGTEDDDMPLVLARSGNTLSYDSSFPVPVEVNGEMSNIFVDVDFIFTKQ